MGGKSVEEVGFEKVAQQLANLQELRIVLLDGSCIAGAAALPASIHQINFQNQVRRIGELELKIRELDLGRNLLEDWADVLGICTQLTFLCALKLKFVMIGTGMMGLG